MPSGAAEAVTMARAGWPGWRMPIWRRCRPRCGPGACAAWSRPPRRSWPPPPGPDPLDDVLRDLYGRAHATTAERARRTMERADVFDIAKVPGTRWRTGLGGFAARARSRIPAASLRQQRPYENCIRE
jgi:hypothetical protein